MTVISSRRNKSNVSRRSSISNIEVVEENQANLGEVLQDDYEKRKLITFTNTSNRYQ